MAYLIHKYNDILTRKPLITKVISSGAIAALGDTICQYFEHYKIKQMKSDQYKLSYNKKQDFRRTAKFFLLGAFFIAPFLHINYTYVLPFIAPNQIGFQSAFKKILFDQTVLAPTYFFLFYNVVNRLEGKKQSQINEQMRQKFWPTMYMNWRIWPFINFINFLIIPIPYQVLWNNFFSMFFNAYLSYMHHIELD